MELGAGSVSGMSASEKTLAKTATAPPASSVKAARLAIREGQDPLGSAFCQLRAPAERRELGATYTPIEIVDVMSRWAASRMPVRIVDPGAGSGRFTLAASRHFPKANLVATEIDPCAALILRANLAVSGLAARAKVVAGDYRDLHLPSVGGPTLFIGNPPYVRHHLIGADWKAWLVARATALGLQASQLAGLHVHFFLATAHLGKPGDYGVFITAAEWLDVNYGSLVRKLFLGALGGRSVHLMEPTALPFSDADTTAVITCFDVGAKPDIVKVRRVASVATLSNLESGRPIRRERLEGAERWSPLTRSTRRGPEGYVELGELCSVHRGQVTGANRIWIEGEHSIGLPPSVLFPSITKARELFGAGQALNDASNLRRVIDLPVELGELPKVDRTAVEKFLQVAKTMGGADGFIARHRRAWWSVGLRRPAPILATYMARRPPAFVRNLADARHINIAHGIYPRDPLSGAVLDALARHLSSRTTVAEGRMYAGGLTKFEPREMERLLVPGPALLA